MLYVKIFSRRTRRITELDFTFFLKYNSVNLCVLRARPQNTEGVSATKLPTNKPHSLLKIFF